ncbi:MAG: VOC family protein [Firmicutes bacterium]|nr:VOC family protein [Bacillota bacterium]
MRSFVAMGVSIVKLEIERIHHVSLAVRDLQRARAFYTGMLGLQEIDRPAFDTNGIWYRVGELQLHLTHSPQAETLRCGDPLGTDGHFAVWVKSYRDAVQWLTDRGISYTAQPQSVAGFAQIWLLDPDHNIIELDAPHGS